MSCAICCDNLFDNIRQLETLSGGRGDCRTLDRQERPAVLGCGHVFHDICIGAWLAQDINRTCPICRTRHSGDPISLYFANDESSKPLDDSSTNQGDRSVEVNHRNKIIKTLCTSVATAQKETKKVKDDLKDSEIERKKLVDSYNEEKTKAESYKKASNSLRTIISKIKLMTIRLENEIANKSRHIDEQKKRIENLTAELSEQQRVVASMGDVRATNEQLARALKKERTRLETKSELNMNLGRRIYHLETENAELKRAADQPINSQNVITPFSATTSSTQAKKDIPVVDLVSESSHDPDLSEDAEAISDAIMNPWLRYNAPSSQRKLGSTFGVSLKSIESPHSQAFTGVESNKTSSSQANANNANPFAIAEKSFVTLASKEFTFSADVAPQQSTPSSSDRSTRAIQKPTTANVSNGFGGSPRRYFARKHTNTVQAKINWGPKK